ncbi:hypothetical protein Tco_0911470 [Tanacetum coccineum]|uniref:Uncharacterized protein n=1 Tax=Tanacetum coccineum TaxID=301880 RepID=A0ABQ5CWU4_9ASTR
MDTAYRSSWFLVKFRHRYAISSLMDTAYSQSEHLVLLVQGVSTAQIITNSINWVNTASTRLILFVIVSTANRRLILLSEVRDDRDKDYLGMKIRNNLTLEKLRNRSRSTSGIRAFALRNFDLEVKEFESAQSNTTTKLPILKLGEYEMWVIRIKQYFQVQDYALWEVIENGNSWVSVPQTAQENGTSVTKMSVPVTAEEKTNKKNDVKARSLLLMALPNEHQLTFSQYNDAKTMFAAIETRFGGNEATKKTQKTLLKQQYENFSASSTESLDSIFNRLQKIVSRLAILGVVITQEDLNSKFLRSLPPEWNTHVLQLAVLKTGLYDCPSTSISTANFSDNTMYAFMIENPNGSNLLQQDLEQIHEDDLEAMDLKWQLYLLIMRAKSCHKMGHFARECRAPRNKEGQFRYQDNTRKQGNNEDTSSKAMLAIDGVGFD